MSDRRLCDRSEKRERGTAKGRSIYQIYWYLTNMADAIAKYYGIQLVEVLTGFKFIGQKMLEFETKGTGTYLFGMEESYGCLTGTYARDKDAVVASMTLCEAAAYYKTQGKTLWDAMIDMYEKYGYYKDDVKAITLKGIEGLEKIQTILETLRADAPKEIGGYKVLKVRDYKKDTITDLADGRASPRGLLRYRMYSIMS